MNNKEIDLKQKQFFLFYFQSTNSYFKRFYKVKNVTKGLPKRNFRTFLVNNSETEYVLRNLFGTYNELHFHYTVGITVLPRGLLLMWQLALDSNFD